MVDSHADRRNIEDITWGWWVLVLVGVLGVVAGIIVLAKPSHSLTTLAVICGLFVLIDSIFELVVALFGEHSGVEAVLAVLGIVIGVLLIRHPVGGVQAVALLVGIWLLAAGVLRLLRTFALSESRWRLVLALLEIVAGIVIISSPDIGFATLALLVGISFIANGLAMVAVGWLMRAVHKAGPRLEPQPTVK